MSKELRVSTTNYEDAGEEMEQDEFGQIGTKIHSMREKHRAADNQTLEGPYLPVPRLQAMIRKRRRMFWDCFRGSETSSTTLEGAILHLYNNSCTYHKTTREFTLQSSVLRSSTHIISIGQRTLSSITRLHFDTISS